MKRNRILPRPKTPIIHDHFGGSANCVECGGKCRLTGANLRVTRLVRFVMEYHARGIEMWCFTHDALEELLGTVRFHEFQAEAKHTWDKP